MLIDGKKLKGQQRQALRKALSAAFHTINFDDMLREQLGKKLEDIIVPYNHSFPEIAGRVIDQAEEESWTAELLQAALEVRPEDEELHSFARSFTPVLEPSHFLAMERAIRRENPMYDINPLVSSLLRLSACVCHIENLAEEHLGTGFLIGPNIVMTNFHVWEAARDPEDFICRFDYKGIANNNEVDKGRTYGLSPVNWKVDLSEYHPDEFSEKGKDVIPQWDQLDYALLRLAGDPGNDSIRRDNSDRLTKRGWIKPYAQEYTFPEKAPLHIIHHPMPEPGSPYYPHRVIKISMETDAIINENQNKTRVRYKTNTAFGSSGAPCFTADWKLVAIHQSGDPNYKQAHMPEYNQGIPLSAIVRLLDERKIMDSTGKLLDEEQTASKEGKKASDTLTGDARSNTPKRVKRNQQKPKELSEYREQRAARKLLIHESPLTQARQLLDDAQKYVQDAEAPSEEGVYASGHFVEAIELLKAAETSLLSLYEIVCETQSPSETIAKRCVSIKDQIDTISEQIKDYLIPYLTWDNEGDFTTVYEALDTINELIFG